MDRRQAILGAIGGATAALLPSRPARPAPGFRKLYRDGKLIDWWDMKPGDSVVCLGSGQELELQRWVIGPKGTFINSDGGPAAEVTEVWDLSAWPRPMLIYPEPCSETGNWHVRSVIWDKSKKDWVPIDHCCMCGLELKPGTRAF